MKVILIDPFNYRISYKEIEACKRSLEPMHALLSNKRVVVDMVERMRLAAAPFHKCEIWLDEEGLLKPNNLSWTWIGLANFVGCAALCGANTKDIPLDITTDMVKRQVMW